MSPTQPQAPPPPLPVPRFVYALLAPVPGPAAVDPLFPYAPGVVWFVVVVEPFCVVPFDVCATTGEASKSAASVPPANAVIFLTFFMLSVYPATP